MTDIPTLDRRALGRAIEREVGLSRPGAADVIDQVLTTICEALWDGESVKIMNFGVFRLRDKSERPGRHFKDQTPFAIPPMRSVSFKASGKLRDRINGR